MRLRTHSPASIASRVLASTVGVYVLCFGVAAFVTSLGRAAGMDFAESSGLATLIAFALMLVAFCCCFAVRSTGRLWLVLLGCAAVTSAIALLIQHRLVD